MVKKITYLVLLLVAMYPLGSFAQDFLSTKKAPQIGASINLTYLPATDYANGGVADPGFSAFFWNGITTKIDYSLRYNGLFSHYTKSPNGKDVYISEFEGSFHGRIMTDDHLFQPFASAGLGLGKYSGSWVPYVPVGLGLQVNMFSEGYLFLQANYRVSTNTAKVDNNMFYSLGFTIPIPTKAPKPKVVPPPPPPAPVVVKDRDGDGVPDSLDECPDVKGLATLHGCPDRDGDGIADKDDKCPDVKGLARYQGCPIPDTDGDGVNDEEDQCPTVFGTVANHGCPEVKAEVKKAVEPATETVYFAPSSDKLTAEGTASLDNVVKQLDADKTLFVDISGHSDNTGEQAHNQKLSENRAKVAAAYLSKKGIAASRITSAGFGDTKPVADNSTDEGKTKNRRAEIKFRF